MNNDEAAYTLFHVSQDLMSFKAAEMQDAGTKTKYLYFKGVV